MTEDSLDLFEVKYWSLVKRFADEVKLSTRYVEEELILDGELIEVYPKTTEN